MSPDSRERVRRGPRRPSRAMHLHHRGRRARARHEAALSKQLDAVGDEGAIDVVGDRTLRQLRNELACRRDPTVVDVDAGPVPHRREGPGRGGGCRWVVGEGHGVLREVEESSSTQRVAIALAQCRFWTDPVQNGPAGELRTSYARDVDAARGYGQYCPITRAVEVLGERWSVMIVRDLLCGATRFNDIARGNPAALAVAAVEATPPARTSVHHRPRRRRVRAHAGR